MKNAPTVVEQPRVEIQKWRLLLRGDDMHVICQLAGQTRTRLTSALQGLELTRATVQTSSGRVYELIGPPCEDPDFLLAAEVHLVAYQIGPVIDASDYLYAAIKKVAH